MLEHGVRQAEGLRVQGIPYKTVNGTLEELTSFYLCEDQRILPC